MEIQLPELTAQLDGAAASFPLRTGGAVCGAIALAAREVGYFDAELIRLLAIMREEAQRLERLVRELLDFARPLTPSLGSESIGRLVHAAAESASLEVGPNHARISAEIAPDVPLVRVDASMMRQAFVNVLVNALQAAGASGTADLDASIQKLEIRRFARVDISDTGPGITAEIAPRIFDPFFTTKATGTGLGLAVVTSIVESHGGFMHLNSVPGAGTTISISIPVDAEQPAG